jgi:hypothetical protein
MRCSGYRGVLDALPRAVRERRKGSAIAVGALVRAALQAIDADDLEHARRLLAGVLRALGEHPATPSRQDQPEARGQP